VEQLLRSDVEKVDAAVGGDDEHRGPDRVERGEGIEAGAPPMTAGRRHADGGLE
jgi:hypothetical protein